MPLPSEGTTDWLVISSSKGLNFFVFHFDTHLCQRLGKSEELQTCAVN